MARLALFRSRAVLVTIAVLLLAGGIAASLAVLARPGLDTSPTAAVPSATPTYTATATATATPSPTATPRPTATPTPKPRPTATPFPTGPNPPGNWMAVSVDYSYAGCHGGTGGKRTYPLMYLTNTYPNSSYIMAWLSNLDISGDSGNELVGGHTQTIRLEPEYGPAQGVLKVKIYTPEYPYSDVQGHWDGTVSPC